ncbi:hypothetical protein SAMN05444166_6276 [Singulisphaera sp. GP187]|uniref:hypothetical protein n=1 Tax=Singulisphaera sp. GP187 TaxID=1882752 RepID=UPI0009290BAC|nr:hypothetical protein [Singulisphaera sp. GP187]SIO60126.1 hypothetical protein SAMN05444166_6276 [Singulisphaera sp. GP187]
MRIISIVEKKPGGREAKRDQIWKRSYRRTWYVQTDDARVGPGAILAALPVAIGQVYDTGYESDHGSFCQSLTVTERDEDGRGWEAVAEYGPYDASQFAADPVDRQPQVSWDEEQYQEAITEDVNGKPIVNSAGDPFDPPVMKDRSRPILVLIRNEPSYDPALAHSFQDKINSTPFFGADPEYVKVKKITPQRAFNPDIGWYWVVTYNFVFNDKPWKSRVPNLGFRRLDPSNSQKKIEITDEYGQKISSPWPLSLTGQPLPKDSNAKAVTLEFDVHEKIDFAVFNFNDFFAQLQGTA